MMKTKEAELMSAVLIYAVRCIAEGDYAALRQLQIGQKEIDELKRIGIRDLYHAGSIRSHCVTVSFNRELFWSMVRYMKTQTETEDDLQALIDTDAPYEMVRDFFGSSTREYTRRRRASIGLTNAGRPQEPTEEEVDRLWDMWKASDLKDASGRLGSARDYIDLAEESDVSLRSIWLLTERWVEDEAKLADIRANQER